MLKHGRIYHFQDHLGQWQVMGHNEIIKIECTFDGLPFMSTTPSHYLWPHKQQRPEHVPLSEVEAIVAMRPGAVEPGVHPVEPAIVAPKKMAEQEKGKKHWVIRSVDGKGGVLACNGVDAPYGTGLSTSRFRAFVHHSNSCVECTRLFNSSQR